MKTLFSIAVATALLAFSTFAAQVEYFPPDILAGTPQSSQSMEQWYSEQLNALREPSIWELSKKRNIQTYRFLWLRSFHHPISVRLDVYPSGSGMLTTKVTSGQGGYKPGSLVLSKTRPLRKEETDWVLDRIKDVGFWGLETYEKPHESVGPNGEKSVEVGLDGAQWILEGAKDGRYQVTQRWSPENGPVRTLGIIMLIDMAKLKLLYQEVY